MSVYTERGGGNTVRHYIEQLGAGFEWKMVLSIMGSVVAMLEGFYGELMWGFLALFALDLLTGIMKSRHLGVPITSKRLRESVTKLGAYMVLVTALIITSKFENSFVPIVTVAYYYFMFTELKSIFENVEEMGVKVPPGIKGSIISRLDELGGHKVSSETSTVEVKTIVTDEEVKVITKETEEVQTVKVIKDTKEEE